MITVNDINITTWGAVFQAGALEKLLERGVQKPFTENDFRSIDGKQVLPKNPRQEARTFAIDISIKGSSKLDFLNKYDLFFTELAKGVSEVRVATINKTFKLIYIKSQMYMAETDETFASFRVTFEEINPADR